MSKLGWFIRICIFIFLICCFSVYDYFYWDVLCDQDAAGKVVTLIVHQSIAFVLFYSMLDVFLVEIPHDLDLI